jgi:hypothetical protein
MYHLYYKNRLYLRDKCQSIYFPVAEVESSGAGVGLWVDDVSLRNGGKSGAGLESSGVGVGLRVNDVSQGEWREGWSRLPFEATRRGTG